MQNLQPTKVKINRPTTSKRSWQDNLRNLIQRYINCASFTYTENLQLDELDKLEILMDFEEKYTDMVYFKANDDEFVKCKSFSDMVNYLLPFMNKKV